MKKNVREIIILCIQLFMFYIFPIFMYVLEPITTIILMLLTTLVLSILLAIISNEKIKYLYPGVISIMFLPTVFIYYNESALVHSIWYLVIAIIGLFVGNIIKIIINPIPPKGRLCIKKIILIILILVIIGIIIYFANYNEFTIVEESNVIENGIVLSIKENTITKKGITLILKNDSNEEVVYSEEYQIEVKKDKVWQKINVEMDFIELDYVLKSQDSDEININWEKGYGQLYSGDYRIIKEIGVLKANDKFDSFFVFAEFTIQ